MTIDKLLDQFVRSKGTGRDIPGVCSYQSNISHLNNQFVSMLFVCLFVCLFECCLFVCLNVVCLSVCIFVWFLSV